MIEDLFRPMLAATVEDIHKLQYPLLASPKLDGVRALVSDNGLLVSRNLKLIPNKFLQETFGTMELAGLDGELVCGHPGAPDCFRKTSSGVMSEDGEPDVTFYAFDFRLKEDEPFEVRLQAAMNICSLKTWGKRRVHGVVHKRINDPDELLECEKITLNLGYEGLMLRDPDGYYKRGRSTLKEGGLIKLKRFSDSEAEIIGFEEQWKNENEAKLDELGRTKRSSHKAGKVGKGTLGSLMVKDLVSGVTFDCGTGFDDGLRAQLWKERDGLPGRIIKYRYFPSGSKSKPRFPIFLGFRDRRDM